MATYTNNTPRLDGFKLLGIPVGNSEYVHDEMSTTLRDMATTVFKILAAFPDQQIIIKIYVTSVLAKIPYHVGSDSIANALDTVERGTSPSIDWISTFSDGVNSLSQYFLQN